MSGSVQMSESTQRQEPQAHDRHPGGVEAELNTIRRVLVLSALLFFISSVFFIGLKRTDWFPWVGDCYPSAKPGHFLAYCHSIRYGDYEHYAYYHESEPEAIAQVKQAQVVFLGSSNTQFAFSTQAVVDYFEKISVPHYVLGFGHGAQSGVAQAVAKKLALNPAVWVVNADPFFTGEMNATFERIFKPSSQSSLPLWLQSNIHGEHSRKRWLQAKQSVRCAGDSSANDMWCEGGADTLHRNAANGHWLVENYRENLQRPVGKNSTSYIAELEAYVAIAEAFMLELGIDRECLVITATPRTDTPSSYAKALALKIGSPYVAPMVTDLKTIDDFHLDPDSSERWSEAFLQQLTPYIERCGAD